MPQLGGRGLAAVRGSGLAVANERDETPLATAVHLEQLFFGDFIH